ncbi:MAG: acetamidase/formamidase family protein [Candidatus Bathyarchaeia archaeon]
MRRYSLPRQHVFYNFSRDTEPALIVSPPCIINIETIDVFCGQLKQSHDIRQADRTRFHPVTGPVYIEGAEPGDVLAIEIKAIQVEQKAWQGLIPGHGLLKPREFQTMEISVTQNKLRLGHVSVPIRPMIGIIGVAPPYKAIPSFWPGNHGGNIDTKEVTNEAIVLLPVFHSGALFGIGDVHALQGDGEVCGMGAETSATVEIFLRLFKTSVFKITTPWIKYFDSVFVLTSARTIEEAATEAIKYAVEFLHTKYGVTEEEAYCLCSLIGDLQISQVVNPWVTVKFAINMRSIELIGKTPHILIAEDIF